ncbi:hypothetical protein [Chitinophaga agri]|uniref:Uncharacterized protein n=1 Tax=Chitinophaga agri TaxID=2703787 RepID=A0A6B9ZLQ1_9BACT|nr:hypothetical protein [Chitinophaga agri]QHS63322.1 hypothetical protein GWR21_28165 [Chitinophaga agri]
MLKEKVLLPDTVENINEPLLAMEQYSIDANGDFYINIGDKHHLTYHNDRSRLTGCCGPSRDGLSNLVCVCRAEIGREVSDCLDPHFIILHHTGVLLKEDQDGLLEEILRLPVPDNERQALEMLIQYRQITALKQQLARLT